MANRINSTQIYTPENGPALEVTETFTELMEASTARNSLYIKAKESLIEYFASEDCILSEREKASMLAELVSTMAVQMTNSTLNAAVEIAKVDRDAPYELTKAREEILLLQEQRDKVAAENENLGKDADIKDAEKDNLVIQGWKTQADMIREDGLIKENIPSTATAILPATSIANRGLKWEQEQQTKMSVYATLAKSFRESGVVTWTVDAEGKINMITDALPSKPGLTNAQTEVAVRQEIAFDDNKRQHAANSSANMIGLLLSAEESGNITAEDVTKWRNAVDYLNTTTP